MKLAFRLLGIAAAVAAIVSMTGCPTPGNNNGGQTGPVTPTGVTVTGDRDDLPEGAQRQFGATVTPAAAPQAVTWTVEPTAAGTAVGGLLVLTGASEGDTVTVRATAVGHPTVYGTAVITVAAPVTPTSVTVTPDQVLLGEGGRMQFSAEVGPTGAPQAVTWGVEPPAAGTIDEDGLLQLTGASEGETVTVRATATGHSDVSGYVEFDVAQTIRITLTGVPSEYHGDSADVELRHDGRRVAGGYEVLTATTAFYSLYDDETDAAFGTPGTYEILLTVWLDNDSGARTVYRIASHQITVGDNEIAWEDFDELPPINITVTGILAGYHNTDGWMALTVPGGNVFNDTVSEAEAEITGASETFTLPGVVLPGTFDVFLAFLSADGAVLYTAPARHITAATHAIPWTAFVLVPAITITVTDIPQDYHGGEGLMTVVAGEDDYFLGIPGTIGASTEFSVWYVQPGIFDVVLWLEGETEEGTYLAENVNVTATGTTIPWASFIQPDSGSAMTVTVTGITGYDGETATLTLFDSDGQADEAEATVTDGSAVFRFWDAGPETYDLELSFDGGGTYELEGETLYDGIEIPFDSFD